MTLILEKLKKYAKPCLYADLEAFAKWLKYKNLSDNTVKSYLTDLYQSLQFFGADSQISLEEIIELDINDYRAFLAQMAEKSVKTQERMIASWRKWAKFKAKDGIEISFNKITYPKAPKKSFPNIELETVEKFIQIYPKNWKDQRNKAIITLLYSAGLRINEALGLRWTDIQKGQKGQKYLKILGKGGKIRFTPLLPQAFEELMLYKAQIESETANFDWDRIDGHIFASNQLKKQHASSVARDFRTICTKENLPPLNPHKLRHACATHLLKSGCNLRTIQTLLGHSSLETTKIYIQHSTEELQNIHKKIIDKK